MYGDEPLWHDLLDRLADLAIASLRSQVGGRRPGRAAVRLAGPARSARPTTARFVLPHSAKVLAAVADLGVPRIHFGVDTGELLGLMAEAGADVVGRRLAGAARRRPPPARRRHRRAGQPRPGRSAWPRGTSSRPRRPRCSPATPADPGHIFNLGHGVLPETDPAVLDAARRARPRRGERAVTATDRRASLDGVRHAGARPTTSRPTTPTSAGAGRRRPSSWPTSSRRYDAIGGLSPLAARTEAQRAALAARPRRAGARPVRGRARPQARRPVDRGRASPPWRRGCRTRSSGSCWRPHCSAALGGRVPRAGRPRRPRRPASPTAPSSAGTSSPPTSTSRPPPSPAAWRRCRANTKVLFTAHSLPERVIAGGDPYAELLRETAAGGRRARRPGAVGRLERRLAVGRAHPRAVARARRAHGDRGAGGAARRDRPARRARSGSWPTTSRCSTTSTSRPAASADERGLAFARTPVVNDDPAVMGALADLVVARGLTWPTAMSSSSAAASPA